MKILKSIRLKFLGCLLGISILPILIMFAVMVSSNMEYYNSQISMASDNEVKKMVSAINNTFTNLEELMTSLIFSQYDNDSCLLSICAREGKGSSLTKLERLYNYRKFEYVSSNMIGNNQYAEGVYLFTESGYIYSFVKNREYWLELDYESADWYQDLQDSGQFQIIEPFGARGNKEDLILLARKFTDVKGKNTGILAMVCNDKMFDTLGDSSLPWGQSFIMDGNGNVIDRDSEHTDLDENDVRAIMENEKGFMLKKDTNDALIYGTLNINDWKIVSEVSFESQKQLYVKNMGYLISLILIIVLFVILLVWVSERVFINPLVQLSKSMKEAPSQDLRFDNSYQKREDEIGVLYRRFDKMIKEINLLIKDKYIGEIKYLKSRLQNLMSQINAHFIFNTLENINCLAQIEKNTQIGIMSKSLGDMLRYSIEYEEDEERLRVEIEHIRSYINIQEIRFGNPIVLKIEAEEELLDSMVLKFMLQPVVENAIEHGMAGEEQPWELRVAAYKQAGCLIVDVLDNGAGMEEDTLEKVRHRIYHPENLPSDARYESIGLSNIHQRIRLLYGGDYGIEIDSQMGQGTRVRVKLPVRNGRGKTNDRIPLHCD